MNKKFQYNNLLLSDVINDETEFFPIMSDEDEQKIDQEKNPDVLPILPLRNTVLFPGVIIPITITRARSIQLIKDAEKGNKIIGVVSQKDSNIELPKVSDLNKIGTVAQILKVLKMPDGNITAVIQGRKRFELDEVISSDPYYKANINKDIANYIQISRNILGIIIIFILLPQAVLVVKRPPILFKNKRTAS